MTRKQLQLGILFFTVFIDMLGFGIVMPILPRYVETLGAASWQMGLLVGIFSLAQLVMLPLWGHYSDRIGRKPVLIISIFGTVIGYLIMGLTRSVTIMMVARMIDGAAGGNISVVQASLSDISTPEERSSIMGKVIGAAYGIGFILGPALGGWLSYHYGFASPMLITAGLAAVNLLLILFFLPETLRKKEKETTSTSLLMLLKHVEKKTYIPALMAFFFFVLGFSMVTTLLVLFFYHRYGMSEQQTGSIYAMFGIIAIVLEGGFFGLLSKYVGDRLLAILGAFFLMTSFFFISLTWSVSLAVIACVIMALGDSLITPALPSIVSRTTHEQWQGAAFGCYQSAGCLARFFGPLLGGILLQVKLYGMSATYYAQTAFWVASGFLVIALVCAFKIPVNRISK
jgi:DHA1 family tetracycline resistance protein-like MFS transporter